MQSIVHDKDKIDEILNYAVGRNVPVVDAFHLDKLKHSTDNLVWVLVRHDLDQYWSSWDVLGIAEWCYLQNTNCRNLSLAGFLCELICLLMNKQSNRSTGRVANGDLTQTNE